MISIEHEDKLTVVGVFGEFHVDDYRKFEQEVGAQLKAQGRLNLLIDFRGMLKYTIDVALEDIRFAREHANDVGRIAIISDQDLVAWMAFLTALFVEADIRVFDSEDIARNWLAKNAD
ncbi:MAG: STAS/SEC14 domain-containing protein [Burkholderiales bacterium]|nr:STAS/SEC14 domain-containing protein [Burkholderiales bacterium]